LLYGGLHRELITQCAQSGNHANGDIREIGVLTKCFSCVYVGQMNLYERYLHTAQGITQCHTGMCEGRRIDQNKANALVSCQVNTFDQFGFSIALYALETVTAVCGLLFEALINLLKRILSVMLGLTGTQQIQVGSIDDEQIRHVCVIISCHLSR